MITHLQRTYKLREFVAEVAGLKSSDTHVPDATCGTALCCNPDHYALRPRKVAKNKKG